MSLCSRCQNFDLNSFPSLPDQCRAMRLSQLRSGSQSTCEFCRFLWTIATEYISGTASLRPTDHESLWLHMYLETERGLHSGAVQGCFGLRLIVSDSMYAHYMAISSDPSMFEFEIAIAAVPSSEAARSGVVGGRYLGQSRTSPIYINAIKDWLFKCIKDHEPRCGITVSKAERIEPFEALLPSRCIEITSPTQIALRNCKGQYGPYVTISHKWTTEVNAQRTTAANLDARCRGEGFEQIPQDLRDAIRVVYELGIPYIWIDSLCIVQDDQIDLKMELVQMARYYQFSIATIAIESPTGQSSGFLSTEAEKPFDTLIKLPYVKAGKPNGNVFVYKRKRRADLRFNEEVDKSKLLSRGWVCQEWFLSRRVVHFTPFETFLECVSQQPRSVCSPVSFLKEGSRNTPETKNHRSVTLRMGLKATFSDISPDKFKHPLDDWYILIKMYSNMQLTVQADHLNAIAGIASEFSTIATSALDRDHLGTAGTRQDDSNAKVQYISGLWLSDIHYGLLWQATEAEPALCTCDAPSWSWLSIRGPVVWPQRYRASIPQCRISYIGDGVSGTPLRNNEQEDNNNAGSFLTMMTLEMKVYGVCVPVLVRGYMPLEAGRTVATITADEYSDSPAHRSLVSSTAAPEITAGWATIERPDHLLSTDNGHSYITLALHVATRPKTTHGNWKTRVPSIFGSDVIDVLFLEPMQDGEGRFHRVGVGSLFGRGVLEEFRATKAMEITLV